MIETAMLTDERVSIDWSQDEEKFHLVADSKDGGRTYEGTYGTPAPDPMLRVRLTRLFTFDDVPRLVAHWLNHGAHSGVQSLFEFAGILPDGDGPKVA